MLIFEMAIAISDNSTFKPKLTTELYNTGVYNSVIEETFAYGLSWSKS